MSHLRHKSQSNECKWFLGAWWRRHIFSSAVLQGCKGLVDVWLLLLRTTGVHGRVLHTDDKRDAQPQEGQPSDRPHWAPETGRITILKKYYPWSLFLPARLKWRFSAEEGGGQGRLLPGPHLCAVLVPTALQQDSKEDGLRTQRHSALQAVQVRDLKETSKAWRDADVPFH